VLLQVCQMVWKLRAEGPNCCRGRKNQEKEAEIRTAELKKEIYFRIHQ
jgi:hypothetical protein